MGTMKRRKRAKLGTRSKGRFFHIEVRPSRLFAAFRVQDVGAKGAVERVAGRRASGSWATQRWLIEKTKAHRANGTLVADSAAVQKALDSLGSRPVHIAGDRFKAKPRHDIPETFATLRKRSGRVGRESNSGSNSWWSTRGSVACTKIMSDKNFELN